MGTLGEGGQSTPLALQEGSIHVSAAAIRHAGLIKDCGTADRVHVWKEDKGRPLLLFLSPLPKDPALISHSGCYLPV